MGKIDGVWHQWPHYCARVATVLYSRASRQGAGALEDPADRTRHDATLKRSPVRAARRAHELSGHGPVAASPAAARSSRLVPSEITPRIATRPHSFESARRFLYRGTATDHSPGHVTLPLDGKSMTQE